MRNNIYLNSLIVRDIAKISITFCNKTDPSEHLNREITRGVSLRQYHHGVSMLRTVFELSLSSRYICQYVSIYLTFNCTVKDGLLMGYDSRITIFVIY